MLGLYVGMLTKMSLIGTILIRRSSGAQAVGHKVGAYVGLLVAARDILWSQAAVVAQVMTIHATPFLCSCFIVKKNQIISMRLCCFVGNPCAAV
jgi:hypothetical protein